MSAVASSKDVRASIARDAHHRAIALPAGLLIVVFGAVSGSWTLATALLALLVVSFIPLVRLSAGPAAQLLIWLSGIVTAFLLTARVDPDAAGSHSPLPALWFFVGLTGVLLIVPRLYLRKPIGGARVSAAMGLVTLMAFGGFAGRRWIAPVGYGLLCCIWILLTLFRLRSIDPELAPSPRRPARSAAVIALAIVLAAPLVWALPPLHQ
ncbi:MAG: hypothetical protein ACI9OJ_004460, partial [Myxococcota bacterium]